jgi:hypothetical protein
MPINYRSQEHPIYWDGIPTAVSGSTNYGYWDSDVEFQRDAQSSAKWAATRLGYPIVTIEFNSNMFYSCFEEAVQEYCAQVNQWNSINNMIEVQGMSINDELTGNSFKRSPRFIFDNTRSYEAYLGHADVDIKKWYIDVVPEQQEYDLTTLWSGSVSGKVIVQNVYHYPPYPYSGMGNTYSNSGWDNNSVYVTPGMGQPTNPVTMFPLFDDILKSQAIEMAQQIRKSSYGFQINNNKIRIFPIPISYMKIWIDYILEDEIFDQTGEADKVTDISNIPYSYMSYSSLNSIARQWIKNYFLALTKITLGTSIRAKFASVPVPEGEVQLNGGELASEGNSERERLLTELRETLEKTSRRYQLESKREEADNMNGILKHYPAFMLVK